MPHTNQEGRKATNSANSARSLRFDLNVERSVGKGIAMFAVVRQDCCWRDRGKTLRSLINVGPGQAAKRLGIIDDVSFARRHERFLTPAMHESTASWSRFLNATRENLPIVNSRAFARSEQ
jgi:hypothetical protein